MTKVSNKKHTVVTSPFNVKVWSSDLKEDDKGDGRHAGYSLQLNPADRRHPRFTCRSTFNTNESNSKFVKYLQLNLSCLFSFFFIIKDRFLKVTPLCWHKENCKTT